MVILTLISVGGGSSSPPQQVSVRRFYVVRDNELSFGDFYLQNLSKT